LDLQKQGTVLQDFWGRWIEMNSFGGAPATDKPGIKKSKNTAIIYQF
jgi:hypothetical protein